MRPAMPTRSGAALIIALVVLAALLLLGLPFLFTQSSSLAGTRSFAHSQQALIGRASAENVGVAAAAAAMDYHWRSRALPPPPALDEWTSLYWGLSNGGTLAEVRRLGETRVGLDLRQGTSFRPDPLSTEPTLGGATISDEHGKLDPNHLDSSAWTRLLDQVGIKDWDDGTPPTPDVTRNQLARALADLRFRRDLIPDGRIMRLDQLLLAVPPTATKRRHGLTRAELAQVAPYLSLHGMAQARGGLIDLGTVINDVTPGGQAIPDSLPPGSLLAHPIFPTLVGPGSVIVDANDDGSSPGFSQPDTRDPLLISPGMAKGRALAIDAPPPVNLHEASAVVRTVLFAVPAAQPPSTATDPPAPSTLTGLKSLGALMALPNAGTERIDALEHPRTPFDLLDPLGIVQDVISANAFGSRPGYSGVSAGAPALGNPANGNTMETVVVVGVPVFGSTFTVEATARDLHLTGSGLNRLPSSGYARLDGREVPGDPLTQLGVTAREYVYFGGSSASGTTATLSNVTRGIALPPGSGTSSARRFFVDGLKVTILSARELPPLAIASPGIVTVETAATATDPAGRQTAQQTRTVVAQTVAQEFPLEARWERQSQFHATLAQRQGSLMASFPAAVDRVQGRLPDEAVSPATPPAPDPVNDPYLDKRIGVRPAVLKTPLSGSHIYHEWTASLAGRETGNDALRGGRIGAQEPALNYSTSDLFPEGVKLSASRRLAWLLAPGFNNFGDGFFKHPVAINGTTSEILPRQFGFWVRPDATWSGRTEPVILFEVRGPIENAGHPLRANLADGTVLPHAAPFLDGSTALQNYLGLTWSKNPITQVHEFTLAFGTGAIEHVADYGPAVPSDNYAITAVTTESKSPAVDNSSLGADPVNYHPLAPGRPMNRIEHRYHFDAATLRPGTWHLIQVAFSGTRPDHASILVDGLVGRRVDEPAAATADGDHYAMPRLRLATALAESHQNFATLGASVYRIDEIELTGPAAQVLPKRGMVLIGNEYISYQRLTGNKLQNCWRGRRQNSRSLPGNPALKPAITEAHSVGDQVFPGGYHTEVGALFTGGNTLAGPLSNGDTRTGLPIPTPHPYQVWGAVKPPVPVVPPATTFALPDSGDLSLQLYADALNDQFPSKGFILINNDELAFYTRDPAVNPPLLQILAADRWLGPSSTPVQGTRPSAAAHVHNLSVSVPSSTPITLVSAELAGPDDPTVPGKFAPANFSAPGLLQLYDANGTSATHRAEWVRYQDLITRNGVHYVLNYNGFDANERGQRRTAFSARDLADLAFVFPQGTRVLPVQAAGTYLVETGDVLTLARKQLSKNPGEQPWQSVVRFAEKDGWGLPDAMGGIPFSDANGKRFDTDNGQFAFCEAVPQHFANRPCNLLCWPCWTAPRDLTTVNDGVEDNPVNLLDLLPWGNAWATGVLDGGGVAPTDDRRIYLGADDERNISVPGTPTTMAIDALWSGSQPAQGTGSLSVTEVYRSPSSTINPIVNPDTVWISNAETLTDLAGSTLAIPGLPGTSTDHLLASVGGEVMALRHLRDPMTGGYIPRASVVGRALFGSTALNHHGREPVLILPLGPVTPLASTLSPTDQDAAPFATLDAPTVMVMAADGSSATPPEVIMTPNGRTAPWLRGMYGTAVGTWAVAAGSPPPLAVGWWPRYPSAVPHVTSTVAWGPAGPQRTAWTNAQLRSRSYAWAGFPLRFHGASFYADGTNGAPTLSGADDFRGAQIDLIDDAGGLYEFDVRALAAGFAWQQSPIVQPSALGVSDVSDVFASGYFRRPSDGTFRTGVSWKRNDPIPVDGAELRVTWSTTASTATTMQGALLDLARHNRAPMIGPVRLRCRAPSQVLSVEAAR